MPRELTSAELADLLRTTERSQARSAPVSMRAAIARGAVAGVGTILALGGALLAAQAPLDTLAATSLIAGVVLAGIVLLVSAIPTEKIAPALLTLRRLQQVQAAVLGAEFRKRKAYEAIEALEQRHAAEIKEWQRAITELRNENKVLRSDLVRYQEERRTPTFVTRSKVAPETIKDAQTILEYWFATLHENERGEMAGEWWSRPKAVAAGWTKTRHKEASDLLLEAGITSINEKLPFVQPRFTDMSAALYELHTYCNQTAREPDISRRVTSYVELENG